MATSDTGGDSESLFWKRVADGNETADVMFQRIGRSSTILKTGIRFLDEQVGIRSRDVRSRNDRFFLCTIKTDANANCRDNR